MAAISLIIGLIAGSDAAPVPGDSFKKFTMVTSKGTPVQWAPGRIAVISCMAFWCDTWKTQAPRLEVARKASAVLPVDFIQIIVDGRYSKFAAQTPFNYWLDRDGAWSKEQGIDRVPYTFVVDAAGQIRWAAYGIVRSESLAQEIRKAMQPATDGGKIYLTFDDFPNRNAGVLLDTLRAKSVKATFFCIGRNSAQYSDIVRRAVQEGHSIQMHSWQHDATKPELERLTGLLNGLGAKPVLYRPPGSEAILRGHQKLAMRVVNPYDYANPKPEELLRRIMHRIRSGCVIQLHSGAAAAQNSLSEVIDRLARRGFSFDTLK